ncbi:MAG: heme-binding protein [Gammaproteobacteria bacterium]|nr:heme-binding protein [Gammaproteobacteria bacterium]MDE2350229.1 heme-binding protein [Gammaproteobacteria bacterium]
MWVGLAVALALVGAVLAGPLSSRVEHPKYHLVEADGKFEIRDYPAMIVAQVELTGPREATLKQGFRMIAGYIFGGNSAAHKVSMTAPVTQQAGARIAMTAPVAQQAVDGKWCVRFVMPAGYTLQSLPRPNDPAVKLEEIPARRFAVIRFSGLARERSLARHEQQLDGYVRAKGLKALSAPIDAYYNPPWTLPFLRRNEIMLQIAF